MPIRELGYLAIEATDVDAWGRFAQDVLGLSVAPGPEGGIRLKMDERDFRLEVVSGKSNRLVAGGWGVGSKEEFEAMREQLNKAGFEMQQGSAKQAQARMVQELFSVIDPEGARQEIFWGPIAAHSKFVSPMGVRFVTGDMGLGHIVVPAMNFEPTHAFWSKGMGFGLSDILNLHLTPDTTQHIYFMHCNSRQHSIAIAQVPSPAACHHIMLEVASLDDVGMTLDRVREHNVPLVQTLGRHVNDEMVSFYVEAPGGIVFEIGCGGLVKQWEGHTVFETTRGSHWGHHWVPRQ